MTIQFELNGKTVSFDGDPDTPLLWVVRDVFDLTGTKYGCGIAQCGACTVHMNGHPRRACVTPMTMVDGADITTIEGLEGAVSEAVQEAWETFDTPQCGWCQSGQIMTAVSILTDNPGASDADIDAGMAGNVCRCATYVRIRKAIRAASEKLEA